MPEVIIRNNNVTVQVSQPGIIESVILARGSGGPKGDPGTDGINGTNGLGVPPGGAAGTILTKNSATDNDTKWAAAPPSTPSGAAGGDLAGTYPNPTIKTALNDPLAATPGLRTLGTGAQQAAAGDDSRITGAAQKASNLSDLGNAATARTNLGLGTAAVTNTGTGAANTILGNDARLADARTPTAHAHAAADLTSGTIATARLGSGTADSTKFLRGDQTWATPSGGGGGLLASVSYNPASITNTATTATSLADVDATNLVVTFTAPASGKVLVRLNGLAAWGSGSTGDWGVRSGTTTVFRATLEATPPAQASRYAVTALVTGLTSGNSYTYKFAHDNQNGNTTTTTYGGIYGAAVMEVWSA